MEQFEFGAVEKSTATAVTKPTIEITKLMSNELLKIYELKEYCNHLENNLKKEYEELEILVSAKNEASKTVAELKNKNRINATNSESLLQALGELHKYKSEVKSDYIATEKALKAKKLKYKNIISSYESSWQKALKEYDADPVSVELRKIQEENILLETETAKQERLKQSTETQLADLKENLKKRFRESTVEFSKAMLQYKRVSNSTKRNWENESQNSKGSFQFKLFRAEEPQVSRPGNSEDANYICNVDVSVFDDITVPSENLESQNLEEDITLGDVSKEEKEEEAAAALEYLNNYQHPVQHKISVKTMKENLGKVDENESQYFRQQPSETLKQPLGESQQHAEQWDRSKEDLIKHLDSSGEQWGQNGAEDSKEMQMECEESISDGSYEQMSIQREDIQCHKTSSVSSEDILPAGENLNESSKPLAKVFDAGRNDSEKNDFKSFTGFFMMGNDQDNSKPSIFKLF